MLQLMELILISGLSGSGKSVALHLLEDAGYYCVDNLPVAMLTLLVRMLKEEAISKVAPTRKWGFSASLKVKY